MSWQQRAVRRGTGENLILRIDLNGGDAFVSNFVANVPGFSSPDNLALSKSGDLFITEDGGGPDDIWVVHTGELVARASYVLARCRTAGPSRPASTLI